METVSEEADRLGALAVQCIAEAGKRLGFRVPLGGDFKVGDSWASTH